MEPRSGPPRLDQKDLANSRAALAAQRAATLRPAQAADTTGTRSKERSLRLRFPIVPALFVAGWEAVHKLRDAQRGDIIAWELAASTQEHADTGHVVIVAAAPVEQTNHRYRVEVYDSSVIHHDDDSRPAGTTGLGGGVMTFSVGPGGEPVGFQFNSRARFHEEPIALGRLVNS